ncbi:MAG TPA: CHRD domain-containing protein [Nitrososphaeraceae archaeon]|nr:CHRD domain-containing protein [Nitrososphaeraceae archaeon]
MQNKKTIQFILISAALSMLIVSIVTSNFVYAQSKFRAKLEADNEVPPVDSTAKGVATFKLKDESVISKINITGITDISGAQLFFGKIGQNADPIVDLLKTGEKIENPGGVGIEGNFTGSDFGGSMEGKALSDLQSAMATNQTYVNIMTGQHPNGEIAGHVYSKGGTTEADDITANSNENEGVSEEGNGLDNEGISEEEIEESGNDDFGEDEDE